MTELLERFGLRRWINAGGTLTRRGGAVASEAVAAAMGEAARLSLDSWELQAAASRRIAAATGAEAGLVTTGASAALTLAAAAAIAGSDAARMSRLPHLGEAERCRVLMPRGHRTAYDRALATAGARIVDVGDADRSTGAGVRPLEVWEVLAEADSRVAAIAATAGTATDGDLPVLAEAARRLAVPLIVDAAAQLPPRANLRRFFDLGATLVCFSGGKAIGGPQASGILAGRRDLVASAALQMLDMDVLPGRFRAPAEFFPRGGAAALPKHGIGRGFKASKDAVIGLLVALDAFLALDGEGRAATVRRRLEALVPAIDAPAGVTLRIVEAEAVGLPRLSVTIDPVIAGFDAADFADQLGAAERPVALAEGDIAANRLTVDLACVAEGDDAALAAALARACGR